MPSILSREAENAAIMRAVRQGVDTSPTRVVLVTDAWDVDGDPGWAVSHPLHAIPPRTDFRAVAMPTHSLALEPHFEGRITVKLPTYPSRVQDFRVADENGLLMQSVMGVKLVQATPTDVLTARVKFAFPKVEQR